MRVATDRWDISSEMNPTGMPAFAAFIAQQVMNAVLPIEGRPATMMNWPGSAPSVILSRCS